MNIITNIQDLDLTSYGTTYVKDLNYKVSVMDRQVRITDLSNALKNGAECIEVCVDFYNQHLADFLNWLRSDNENSIEFLFKFYSLSANSDRQVTLTAGDFNIYVSTRKGIRTFNPFNLANLKPVKSEPKKMNMTHVYKMLANGQYTDLKCDQHLTDDYAFDAANNFGKNANVKGLELLKKIIESPSGWWVMIKDGRVDFNCHHFLGYSFKPNFKAA